MSTQEKDIYWMRRALELARRGIAVCSPNPAVGCVILDRAGQVAGEGWHEYDLLDHCNHTGRTGPCTEALIAAGIARVVAATIDPNPAVAGHGMDRLQGAGI